MWRASSSVGIGRRLEKTYEFFIKTVKSSTIMERDSHISTGLERPLKEHLFLCEALDRVLNKGAVICGDVTISVANVDLIYLSLQLLITSVETARRQILNKRP